MVTWTGSQLRDWQSQGEPKLIPLSWDDTHIIPRIIPGALTLLQNTPCPTPSMPPSNAIPCLLRRHPINILVAYPFLLQRRIPPRILLHWFFFLTNCNGTLRLSAAFSQGEGKNVGLEEPRRVSEVDRMAVFYSESCKGKQAHPPRRQIPRAQPTSG